MLKTALVVVKAAVLFGISDSSEARWEVVATVLFFTSFLVVSVMTLALSVPKLWYEPEVLAAVGVERPRMFLVQYMLSWVAAKFGLLLLTVSGYAPRLMGCNAHAVLILVNADPACVEDWSDNFPTACQLTAGPCPSTLPDECDFRGLTEQQCPSFCVNCEAPYFDWICPIPIVLAASFKESRSEREKASVLAH